MYAPGTGEQGAAVSLGPEAQDRHAFYPDSFLRVEHAPAILIPSCLLNSQASVSLHWEPVILVLPPADVPVRASSPAS